MPWQDFGTGLVTAVSDAVAASGLTVLLGALTAGEVALECTNRSDEALVAAWLSEVTPEAVTVKGAHTPLPTWTLRVARCVVDPVGSAAGWHDLVETAWCAATAYLAACDPPATMGALTVAAPSGGGGYADLTVTVEDGCLK